MDVVIRTDASRVIGTGHVVRCLTLAEQLRTKGATVHFVSRLHEGHLCDVLEKRDFSVHRLAHSMAESAVESERSYDQWLGSSWLEDACKTSKIITSLSAKPAWLIVDHYALDLKWEKYLRPLVNRILVIDDLADRVHDCDLLLDQNLMEKMHTRYASFIPDSCSLLLGPSYALLQSLYPELHDCIPFREGKIERILIFFGGSDTSNLTGLALKALIGLQQTDIIIDVVLGRSCSNKKAIYELAHERQNINLYDSLPSLAPLIAKADLAIGGGGTTTWERLCFGLPSLVITLADNQKPIADILHRCGLLYWFGHDGEVTIDLFQQTLKRIFEHNLERDWSERCHRTVDGKGTERVATVMLLNERSSLQARRTRVSDEALLLEWANDPETRRNGFFSAVITPEEHHQWFVARLRDIERCFMFIIETQDGVPVGQVRFQREENGIYEVHYSLAKCFRGRNIGKEMLNRAITHFSLGKPVVTLVAFVKKENIPSQKIFQKLNFVLENECNQPILKYFLRTP